MERLLQRFALVGICALGSCAASADFETPASEDLGGYVRDTLVEDQRGRTENFYAGKPAAPGTVATLDEVTNGLEGRKGIPVGDPGAPAPEPAGGERMLIYRGAMTVEVARVEEAAKEFLARVQEWGGYLASQQDQQYTVRLPAAKFDDAFAALRGMGRVLSESRQANDVTEEFVDLGIRLENARKARERLLELLQRAEKVEDILKVEEQLRRLTEEIERMEGRRKFLADQVAMATLAAAFAAVGPQPDKPGGRPSRFPWIRALGAERVLGRW